MSERWAPIPGYEGRWEASTQGRIRSLPRRRTKGGVLVQRVNKRGYPSVSLGHETHEVHRLVALAWLGPRPDGSQVRHIDGDSMNPRASNLAYGTRSDNERDKLVHGTHCNAAKTHCPQGHPYSGDNILIIPSRPTARYCRACNKARKNPDYREEWKP